MSDNEHPRYSPTNVAKIAAALGLERLPDKLLHKISAAADNYFHGVTYEVVFSSLKEQRNWLQKISKLSRKLEKVLLELDSPTSQLLGVPIGSYDLAVLGESAERSLAALPSSGHLPRKARFNFVAVLADIFKETTHKEPTRRNDAAKGGEYGPFFSFVCAAIEPVAKHDLSGVESDIRAVIRSRKERTT